MPDLSICLLIIHSFCPPFLSRPGRRVKHFQRNSSDSWFQLPMPLQTNRRSYFQSLKALVRALHMCLLSLLLLSWRTWLVRALWRTVCRSDRKLKSIAIVSIQVDTLEETYGAYGTEHDNLLKQAEYKQ